MAQSQLEIQAAINKAIQDRTELLKEQQTIITGQLKVLQQIHESWDEADPSDVTKALKDMNEALDEAGVAATNVGTKGQKMSQDIAKGLITTRGGLAKVETVLERLGRHGFPVVAAAGLGFIDGLSSGFKFVRKTLGALVDLTMTLVRSFTNLAVEVAAIPFRSLDGLVAAANKLGPLMEAIARATQEVVAGFGDVEKGPGRAIVSTAKDLGDAFQDAGLGGFKVFGSLDERIQAVNQTAKALGNAFDSLQDEFQRSGSAIMLLQRGLGLTDTGMKGVALRAKATGTTWVKQFQDMTKFSKAMEKATGFTAKGISRDMGEMAADVSHFGNLGYAELAKVSAYAKKLGIDAKDLLGVIEKFDTFEDAATAAAKLSQAFGAQVDVIKLMRAQSPIDRIDELRRGFFQAGKSADNLTRQELKLLAQSTGLSEEAAKVALSQKNQSLSANELEKKMKIAEQRHMTTAKAVMALKEQIELTIKPFKEFASFLQALADGFSRGSLTGEKVRAMLTAVWKALQLTYRSGIELGRVFDKVFPGISETADALKELFDVGTVLKPGAFRTFMANISKTFRDFFDDTAGGGPKSLTTLVERLRDDFFSWFDKDGRGRRLIESFKKFTRAMGDLLGKAVKLITHGIVEAFKVVKDLISGKDQVFDIDPDSIIGTFVLPIWEAIRTSWPIVVTAFKDMWETAWPKIKGVVEPILMRVAAWSALIIFGAAFTKALISAAATKAVGAIAKALLGIVTGVPKASKVGELVEASETLTGGMARTQRKGAGVDWKQIAKIGLGLAIAIPLVALGVAAALAIISRAPDVPIEKILGFSALTLALTGSLVLMMVPLGAMAAILDKLNVGWKAIIPALLLMTGAVAIVGLAAVAIIRALAGVQIPAGFKDAMEGIAALLDATVHLLVVSAALSAIAVAAISTGVGGLLVGAWAVGMALIMGAVVWLSGQLVEKMLPAIRVIAGAQVGDPSTFRAVADVIVRLMETTVEFTKAISSVVSNIKPGWFDSTTFDKNVDLVIRLVGSLQRTGISAIDGIVALGRQFAGKEQQLQAAHVIVDVLSALTSMMSAVAEVIARSSSGGSVGVAWGLFESKGNDLNDNLVAAERFMTTFAATMALSVRPLVASILDIPIIDPEGVQKKLVAVSGALNVFKELADIIKSAPEVNSYASGPSDAKVNALLKHVRSAFGPSQMAEVNGYIGEISRYMPNQQSMDKAVTSFRSMNSFFDEAIHAAEKYGSLNDEAVKFSMFQGIRPGDPMSFPDSPVVQLISGLVHEANAINTELSNLQPIDLRAKLQKLGDSLGLSNQEFTIKEGRVNLIINMNVSMDAADVADVVSKHGVLSTETSRP